MPEDNEIDIQGVPEIKLIGIPEDDSSGDELQKLVEESYLKNKSFFGKDIAPYQVTFAHSRKEYDQYTGQKTPDWSVGQGNLDKYGGILIFHKAVFDMLPGRKAEEYPLLLTHETTHIFESRLFKFIEPAWLREAIAGYVAGQYKGRRIRISGLTGLEEIHIGKGFKEKAAVSYSQSFLMGRYLIEELGKDKLFNLLEILEPGDSYSEFLSKFEKIYGLGIEEFKNNWIADGLKNGTLRE